MRTGDCHHFNGIQNERCKAAVRYVEIRDDTARFGDRLPCLGKSACVGKCAKYSPTTKEEEAAFLKHMNDVFALTMKARKAIIAAKKPHGVVDCPKCEKPGALHFRVSDYNGHVHAQCSTQDCLCWME